MEEVRLDTTHKIIEIAPGIKFSAWTFGDQVPGPVVRARVGDRIKFSMTNRSDEPLPGVRVTAAPMMHSMDFHSAMVAPNDKYRSIAPGRTIDFEFTPNYPGVFMYHCGTPMVLEHIAAGMYGMMVVEPRDGYPTKVDREYAIIQSEFYTKRDPQKREFDGAPLYVLDGERVRSKAPTYTVFNGRYNRFVDQPLTAKAGERLRLFVLNVGPSNTSSFHVVGTILDRVWIEGNPDNQLRGMQTVLLGSSSGAIVEFVVHHVTQRRDETWLQRWMKDPEVMALSDPIGKAMLAKYKVPMPNQNLSDDEIKAYIAYFRWADRNLRPQGQTQPQPAAPDAAQGPAETSSAPRPTASTPPDRPSAH